MDADYNMDLIDEIIIYPVTFLFGNLEIAVSDCTSYTVKPVCSDQGSHTKNAKFGQF